MKYFARFIVFLGGAALSASVCSASIPNRDDPTTFLGPTLQGQYTHLLRDNLSFSVGGELGRRDERVSGTLGYAFLENQRVKVSAEYLRQNINYAFFDGNTRQWVKQGALGAGYQYDFSNMRYHPQFDLDGYYSHAPSNTLSAHTGWLNASQYYTDYRRIAGSRARGVSPGVSFEPWHGGHAGVALNYDDVNYDQLYSSKNENAQGLGGTVKLSQAITDHIEVSGAAGVRRPFNNYQASVGYTSESSFGRWLISLNGEYTDGKNTMPNTYNVGLGFSLIGDSMKAAPADYKGDLKGEHSMRMMPVNQDLQTWTADPAVYMPQVLAIPDEAVRVTTVHRPSGPVCTPPINLGQIPSQTFPNGFESTDSINTAPYFGNTQGVTYSATGLPTQPPVSHASAIPVPSGLSIDSVTGMISGTYSGFFVDTVTVTATNACGSTSQSFLLHIGPPGPSQPAK